MTIYYGNTTSILPLFDKTSYAGYPGGDQDLGYSKLLESRLHNIEDFISQSDNIKALQGYYVFTSDENNGDIIRFGPMLNGSTPILEGFLNITDIVNITAQGNPTMAVGDNIDADPDPNRYLNPTNVPNFLGLIGFTFPGDLIPFSNGVTPDYVEVTLGGNDAWVTGGRFIINLSYTITI